MNTPKLDLLLIDTHNPYLLGIVDISEYPTNYNIVSPTVQITVSGFATVNLAITPKSLNLFNSDNLGISCGTDCKVPISDGIITIKYSIFPANVYNVEKTFLRTDNFQERLDSAFMSLDIGECDGELKSSKKRQLDEIYYFLQMSIAAANKGSLQLSTNLFQKANKMLEKFNNKNN